MPNPEPDPSPDPAEILRDLDALQRDLEATRADAEWAERLETLGTLSGMIAHEFRGIASKIVGNAQLITRHAQDTDKVRDLSVRIGRLGLHAGRIAEAILAAAEEPLPGDCSVLEIHQRALEALPGEARPRVDDSRLNPLARAAIDPDALERVLVNLYQNAWRAVGGASGAGTIRVATERTQPGNPPAGIERRCSARNTLRILISDDGAGVHPELGDSLFEPWSRGAERSGGGSGHGLGLALCRHLLGAAEGSIRFETDTSAGACVVVELPMPDGEHAHRAA